MKQAICCGASLWLLLCVALCCFVLVKPWVLCAFVRAHRFSARLAYVAVHCCVFVCIPIHSHVHTFLHLCRFTGVAVSLCARLSSFVCLCARLCVCVHVWEQHSVSVLSCCQRPGSGVFRLPDAAVPLMMDSLVTGHSGRPSAAVPAGIGPALTASMTPPHQQQRSSSAYL